MAASWYSENPIAETYADAYPGEYAGKAATAPPPGMFEGGRSSLPAFTMSGIDPQTLMRLPYGVRHAAAEEPDISKVYAIFEQYASMPDARIDSYGLTQAEERVRQWFTSTHDARPAEVVEAESRAQLEAYERSQSVDGLLPEERQQQREKAWKAKQAAAQAEADARNAERTRRTNAAYYRNLPVHEQERLRRGGVTW